MALRLFTRKREERTGGQRADRREPPPSQSYQPAKPITLDDDPLARQIQLERFGFVARQRDRWRDHPLVETMLQSAVDAIDDRFALVPEGFVSLAQSTGEQPGTPEEDVVTEPLLIARHCVTNQQFQKFVDSGGYDDLDLWPQDLWPHLINFKDQTNTTGPRYWRYARHDRPLSDHPVAGISYYEAAAYARWAGYRLPTSAEWQMAASWRLRSSAHVLRRYPWGDAFNTDRCNIWLSNIGGTVPVDAYQAGAAPNGVLQLVGNVWEWTSTDYDVIDECGRIVVGDMLLKDVRGGAFDTYFPSQATSCFRTGLTSLARAHNVGFRCVLDLAKYHSHAEGGQET